MAPQQENRLSSIGRFFGVVNYDRNTHDEASQAQQHEQPAHAEEPIHAEAEVVYTQAGYEEPAYSEEYTDETYPQEETYEQISYGYDIVDTPAPAETPASYTTHGSDNTAYGYEEEDELRRITTIHPRSYNDAKIIGEAFRQNIPVIMNVEEMPDADAKRLVDFASGLAFALEGRIERVTSKVFLLTPANLEVLGVANDAPAFETEGPFPFDQG